MIESNQHINTRGCSIGTAIHPYNHHSNYRTERPKRAYSAVVCKRIMNNISRFPFLFIAAVVWVTFTVGLTEMGVVVVFATIMIAPQQGEYCQMML